MNGLRFHSRHAWPESIHRTLLLPLGFTIACGERQRTIARKVSRYHFDKRLWCFQPLTHRPMRAFHTLSLPRIIVCFGLARCDRC